MDDTVDEGQHEPLPVSLIQDPAVCLLLDHLRDVGHAKLLRRVAGERVARPAPVRSHQTGGARYPAEDLISLAATRVPRTPASRLAETPDG